MPMRWTEYAFSQMLYIILAASATFGILFYLKAEPDFKLFVAIGVGTWIAALVSTWVIFWLYKRNIVSRRAVPV